LSHQVQKQLHVIGEVRVGTPTTKALLRSHVPPGIDPKVLLLDLVIEPHGGPDVMCWVKTRYEQVSKAKDTAPTSVEILAGGKSVATVPVKEAH
jgi:hypothetical protein